MEKGLYVIWLVTTTAATVNTDDKSDDVNLAAMIRFVGIKTFSLIIYKSIKKVEKIKSWADLFRDQNNYSLDSQISKYAGINGKYRFILLFYRKGIMN